MEELLDIQDVAKYLRIDYQTVGGASLRVKLLTKSPWLCDWRRYLDFSERLQDFSAIQRLDVLQIFSAAVVPATPFPIIRYLFISNLLFLQTFKTKTGASSYSNHNRWLFCERT